MPTVLLLLALYLQDPPEIRIRSGPYKSTLSAEAYLVELGVTVKDRHNLPVSGLKQTDFELLDNGKPQNITFFSEQKSSTTPQSGTQPVTSQATRSIVLYFDDTHTENMTLQKSRDAAKKFLSAGVRPGDRIALFTASGNPSIDFTSDPAPLLAALDQLKTHPEQGARGLSNCPVLTPYQAYAIEQRLDLQLKQQKIAEAVRCNCGPEPTLICIQAQDGAVQDAATSVWSIFKPQSASAIDRLSQVIRYLSTAPGARLLLMLSPGFVSGGLEQKSSALMDAALRAKIVINALNSTGLSTARSQGMQNMVLGELMSGAAVATGGQYIENNNDLAGGIHRLSEPSPDSYLLGFSPVSQPDDKYHPLKVKVKTGDQVQSRPGYFSSEPEPTIQQRIDRLAASKDTMEEIPATIHLSGSLQVDITVDARAIKFTEQSGRHLQQLTFLTLILDPSGNIIEGKQAVVDLAVTAGKLSELESKGIEATTNFSLPPGHYQVREIIREAQQNHFTARTLPIP
jgi:VWFA-related protein